MYINTSGYKFIELDDLDALKVYFKALAIKHEVYGTVYVSHEGVNIAQAGKPENIVRYKAELAKNSRFNDIFFKDSTSEILPFHKVVVKIKPEVIALNAENANPSDVSDTHLEPEALKQWLDEKRKVVFLDTRNRYEYNLGSFDNAINPEIETFKQFPDFVDTLPESYKDETIVMFCTGGVRCEKAAPLMKNKGFKNVYQINGGILNYFEKCGGAHWHGDCFIFDDRVAVNAELQETGATLCRGCHNAVTIEMQQSPDFKPPKQCPYCVSKVAQAL